ncbi:oxidoreductase C-terminal domain-containing protein, partial [Amycolatopsis sp. H20-H5]|uniref:oxidoreductase C-terminal domain-containing protein n=1 Tax=Amycolatopsis sp. H20-H5 TaxID=3046309 RepID=UPI002DB7FFFB
LLFDPIPRRVEHWLNAVEMGRAAAESLLAGLTAAKPYTPVPRFWSEQHGVRIQAAGMVNLSSEQVQLPPAAPGGQPTTGFVHNGRLVGAVGLDAPADLLHWTAEIAKQHIVSAKNEEQEKAHAPTRPVESGRRRGGAHRVRDGVVTGG